MIGSKPMQSLEILDQTFLKIINTKKKNYNLMFKYIINKMYVFFIVNTKK